MVEQEASMLNENYLRREEEGLRLHKQIEHLTITLSSKDGVILQQEEEISRLRQEVELLVFEINKIENFMQQERGITY
jgi:transcriptional antiterminator Rof (Rho-off)